MATRSVAVAYMDKEIKDYEDLLWHLAKYDPDAVRGGRRGQALWTKCGLYGIAFSSVVSPYFVRLLGEPCDAVARTRGWWCEPCFEKLAKADSRRRVTISTYLSPPVAMARRSEVSM